MDVDLDDEIFGGELSDISSSDDEQDDQQEDRLNNIAAAAFANLAGLAGFEEEEEGSTESEDEDKAGSGDDYRGGAGAAEKAPKDRSLPKFKKAKRTREPGEEEGARPKKQRKRKKKAGTDDDEPAPLGPEEARRRALDEKLDHILKKPKPKKKRRDGPEEDLGIAEEEEVIKLRQEMQVAYQQDLDANHDGRPAVFKLQLLTRVVEMMRKSHLEVVALDSGVLGVMKDWLKPLPDKSLPSLTIQRSLFSILVGLQQQIDTSTLKESEIGKVILFYTKCPRVDPNIKRTADQLITAWLRPLLRRSAAWRDRPIEMAEEPSRAPDRRRPLAASQATKKSEANKLFPAVINEAADARRAKIPQAVSTAYAIAPRSRIAAGDESTRAVGASMERFKAFSSKLKSAKRKA